MIASRLKGNIILGWLICYQVFPSGQVVFRFYYHLINLFEANVVPRAILQIKTFLPSSYRKRRVGFKVSWSLTIYFFVALHSCVCSCPKISRNGFLKKKVSFSAHFAINLFCLHNLKTETNYGATTHRACEWKNKTNFTSYSNCPRVLFDLAHKQCSGIAKGWFNCLTSKSKRRFLANDILLPWYYPHPYVR